MGSQTARRGRPDLISPPFPRTREMAPRAPNHLIAREPPNQAASGVFLPQFPTHPRVLSGAHRPIMPCGRVSPFSKRAKTGREFCGYFQRATRAGAKRRSVPRQRRCRGTPDRRRLDPHTRHARRSHRRVGRRTGRRLAGDHTPTTRRLDAEAQLGQPETGVPPPPFDAARRRRLHACSPRPPLQFAVKTRAGHKDLSMTSQYVHLAGQLFHDAAEALEQRFGGRTFYPSDNTSEHQNPRRRNHPRTRDLRLRRENHLFG